MNRRKYLRQQPVAAHRHPQTRLAELKDEQNRGDGNDRTHGNNPGNPWDIHTIGAEYKGQRVANIEFRIRHHARYNKSQSNVKNGTYY